MSLSVGIQISGVDDYLTQNQVCVLPVNETQVKETKGAAKIGLGGSQTQQMPSLTRLTVRLEDCLSCSGCITSAETILIQQQGLKEFREQVKTNTKPIVCTISDESIASIAASFKVSFAEAWNRVVSALKKEGINEVYDLSQAQDICLMALHDEYLQQKSKGSVLLTSTCPGWVCYAEKMQGSWIFPKMSKVFSSMTIAGVLLKQKRDVFHVSVQPCFDRKLEAIKEVNGKKMVDCVLATSEIEEIIDLKETVEDVSGRNIGFRSAPAKYIASKENKGEFKITRNKDFLEADGIAIANGFRNIQNVVRLAKTNTKFGFIEVESCPGGCVGGGGQVKCSPKERDELLKRMNDLLEDKVVDERNRELYQSIKPILHLELIDRKEKATQQTHLNW
ncbi:Iron hydrogenase large subunit C-terminal domain-containing protein [Entamoeba marina]